MKSIAFATRNSKEILRDPLNIAFGLGFPLILMFLLSAIQANVPVSLFEIDSLAPGLTVFGLSFISLFSGTLIAKDRDSSYLMRLFTSPLRSSHFILGYTLPLLPMALTQTAICYGVSFFLGLKINYNILLAILFQIPAAILFIGIGLLAGSVLTDKQVGGICGALLTNLSAWLSGTWFDLDLVGGTFKKVANALPFVHAVKVSQAAVSGDYSNILLHLSWVIGYGVIILGAAIFIFHKKMSQD